MSDWMSQAGTITVSHLSHLVLTPWFLVLSSEDFQVPIFACMDRVWVAESLLHRAGQPCAIDRHASAKALRVPAVSTVQTHRWRSTSISASGLAASG